ncbi:S8 family peptidase [Paenibacillus sp. J2TS4]|uniref:S8 family peptidase n=1 Tax=Paenibacillus sp. J2TS4 TaxID=2807194 RepID=UPI001B2E3DAC|nr:S8 family peptidase [Paenibacillus sp. J2TS4]GIP35815.1 hypothetical protein J2TS4_50250 [Paenibacillus sp. J2TS4]
MRTKTVWVVLLAALTLIPAGCLQQTPEQMSGDQELMHKKQLIAQDVHVTDQLCRIQCAAVLKQTAEELKSSPAEHVANKLQQIHSSHPHMTRLTWSRNDQPLEAGTTVGQIDGAAEQALLPKMNEAKEAVKAGKNYESEPLKVGSQSYFVLGFPIDGHSSLVGAVHQEVLNAVETRQQQNLRTVPYPADGNWKIESVEAGTHKDIKIDHPDKNGRSSHYHVNEVVVKFNSPPDEAKLKQIQQEIHAPGEAQKLGYTYVFQSGALDAQQLLKYFEKWDIEYAEPHFLYLTNEDDTVQVPTGPSAAVIPNDVLYSKYQWNLPIIATDRGWQLDRGDQKVIVGVVDTGVDLQHPDLKDRLLPGWNVVAQSDSPQDDVGHGTHVAGVIAAATNNNIGVAGMTWYNPVLPVKVLDHTGAGSTYAVAQGIIWATDHGAKVINLSLGNYADANFLHEAVKYAFDRDVVLIAASGNDNTEQPGYPAAYPEVFAVAATDSDKKKASFSNYGDYIDVAAPGANIPSTYTKNQYAALSGTSMASPHVAALAGLIRSVNPLLKNTEVMEIMRKSAADLGTPGKDKYFGYGQIDVNKALQMASRGKRSVANWDQWLRRDIDRIESSYTP